MVVADRFLVTIGSVVVGEVVVVLDRFVVVVDEVVDELDSLW